MKKLIIGLVIGLMLGLSTTAIAAIGDTVSAIFASFNYEVNGVTKTVYDPVLVYEGTSYVRTTAIGNMLGYDIIYKADTRTIGFSKPEPIPIPTIVPTPDTVTGGVYTPTPSASVTPSPTPGPNATPAPSATPSPGATSIPSATPTPVPTPAPTPYIWTNEQAQFCAANRMNPAIWAEYGCH